MEKPEPMAKLEVLVYDSIPTEVNFLEVKEGFGGRHLRLAREGFRQAFVKRRQEMAGVETPTQKAEGERRRKQAEKDAEVKKELTKKEMEKERTPSANERRLALLEYRKRQKEKVG